MSFLAVLLFKRDFDTNVGSEDVILRILVAIIGRTSFICPMKKGFYNETIPRT